MPFKPRLVNKNYYFCEETSALLFDSITNITGTDPMTITQYRVKLVTDKLDFLRANVDDPTSRYEELRAFISDFSFPKFTRPSPITLLRKIVAQNIISRCRALLSLQPIRQEDAEQLDRDIMHKVHNELNLPFQPRTDILTLPVRLHGFDFPSIARINAGIAIQGLWRDLNHHIPAYRNLARITLADWTCMINNCAYPLDGNGLNRNFTKLRSIRVPHAWTIAHKVLGSIKPRISIRMTGREEIITGDVSLSHCFNIHNPTCSQKSDKLDKNCSNALKARGIQLMKHIGKWIGTPSSAIPFSQQAGPQQQ